MKWQFSLLSVFNIWVVSAQELPLAAQCSPEKCVEPFCRCSSADIPAGLAPKDTPQFVLLTFDDGVNVENIKTYRRILYDRLNSNGCKIGTTFYVSHEYTNYEMVNELYNNGFEIALHSISHREEPEDFWVMATYEDMNLEFGGQRIQMAYFANIPIDDIKGIRHPFLQMSGNSSYQVMAHVGLQYDNTWGTEKNNHLWPYTLHYASTQACNSFCRCPTASIPGPWIIPMLGWDDLTGGSCYMVDDCNSLPTDGDGWFLLIISNFIRHYSGNRAPFGFYAHEWSLISFPGMLEGLLKFMDLVNHMPDVFMVNAGEVIDWVQDPIRVDDYAKKPCRSFNQTSCRPNSCGRMRAEHNNEDYWPVVCGDCPAVYPWVGNPLGLDLPKEVHNEATNI